LDYLSSSLYISLAVFFLPFIIQDDDDNNNNDPDSLYDIPSSKPAVVSFPQDEAPGWIRAFNNAQNHSNGGGKPGAPASSSISVLQASNNQPGASMVLATPNIGDLRQFWCVYCMYVRLDVRT